MVNVTFFPLGNADCCRIDLANGKKLLFDYAHVRSVGDATDKRMDLSKVLRDDLKAAEKNSYDLVAFTHLDNDHICGASEFFELTHDKKYMGGDRVGIAEMWVPAYLVCEEQNTCTDEAKLIQKEARHRLKQRKGIRVFSRPASLKKWLAANGIAFGEVEHLITDAGQVVPGFSLSTDGVEFFSHSPFATRQNDGTFVDRNSNSLVFQATFEVDGSRTKFILAADTTHEVWTEIVSIVRSKKRDDRLEWDIFKLPHHCSYKALSFERGKDKTVPVDAVKWLFEMQGLSKAIVVSTSWPIPAKDSNGDDDQPPHRQAANYQRDIEWNRKGQFLVTMEHPSSALPEQLVISIDKFKATVTKRALGAAYITSQPAPRAG